MGIMIHPSSFHSPIPSVSIPSLALGHADAFATAAFRGLEHHREPDALGALQGLCGRGEARLPGRGGGMMLGGWWFQALTLWRYEKSPPAGIL